MGLMEQPPVDARQVVFTPHPVTLEGQRHIAAQMLPGEKLGPFLARTIPDYSGDVWEVRINGVVVPHQVLDRVRPKENTLVEVRGAVHRQALMIVALIALTVFTAGVASGAYLAGTAAAMGVSGATLAAGISIAGTLLINKVLGPKPPKPAEQADPVQSITSARNQPRSYQPVPLLFGSIRITPDILSMPYTWYEGRQQYLGMVLSAGINVHSIEALRNGETLLSSYEGVQVYKAGFTGEADQHIPLYSNADTLAGGELVKEGTWVERTTGIDTVRIQVNLEYLLGDTTSKGKPKNNHETVQVQYRATGSGTWLPLVFRSFVNNNYDPQRATLSADVAAGQYDVRVRRTGTAIEHDNGKAQFQLVSITAVQLDPADYAGIARIGIRIQASGQLNGALDEVRGVAHSTPCPVWNGTAWVNETTSNPGAQLLQYARGYLDENGRLIAGMGLPDEMIDIPALQAFMLHCAAEGYTYDHYLTDPRSHNEVCNVIALAGFGQVSWAGGRFGVVWAAQDQPLSGVVNMATIKRGTFQVDYTLAQAADGIEYTYIDPETWQPATLRVASPGVTTMLNPAQVTGEGITDEQHAARMARWHLAQHLYQYKDVGYGTDLEHLSYRRLSVLALQHDLTQWGYGGRLRGASEVGGVVSIALDEPVPAPSSGNAFVGLRIPGETVYRVFQIQPFSGTSDTLTLVEPWPGDAAFPGDAAGNPAHDTIWCYDFKQTPGLRCRVVAIEPDGDMSGAQVAVVPEPPEFWTYVLTGEYTPPANESLLVTRPVASNLQVVESQVIQGDTVYTELQATFDVAGPMAYATVHAAQQLDGEWGELRQVAETRSNAARFRIPSAGLYRIIVRPHDANGIVGGVASIDYLTEGADIPPPPFDNFDVEGLPGGVRKYTWSYNSTTLQAPDFAGAEIRYIAGDVATPDWATMTPVGNAEGYHPAAFEAVVPEAGQWTFAARARNTSGDLSPPVVITRTLAANLGQSLDEITAEQAAAQAAIDQEIADRIAGDLAEALARGAAVNALGAQVDVVAAQVADILEADEWVDDVDYPSGDLVQNGGQLFRALQDVPAGTPTSNTAYWEFVGNYSSLGEAVAASISIGNQNTSDIAAESTRLDAVTARMPAGSGELATSAMVASEATARATADSALASDLSAVQVRMPAGSGALATAASVAAESSARVAGDAANASAITAVQAGMTGSGNTVANSTFDNGLAGIVGTAAGNFSALAVNLNGANYRPPGVNTVGRQVPGTDVIPDTTVQDHFMECGPVTPGKRYCGSVYVGGHRSSAFLYINWRDAAGAQITPNANSGIAAFPPNLPIAPTLADFTRLSAFGVAPAGAVSARIYMRSRGNNLANPYVWWARPMFEEVSTAQTQPSPWVESSAGMAATAAGLSSVQATVSSQGGTISAQGTQIASLQATAGTHTSQITNLQSVTADTDGRVRALNTVSLNVNGHISGTVNENDGATSSFSVLANVFRVLTGGAASGMEWQANYIRIYGSGYQLVMGTGFGASSNLVQWFGPNIGAAACTTANAVECKTTAGVTIVRGSNAQGSMEMTPTQINIRDSANTLRVQLGMW